MSKGIRSFVITFSLLLVASIGGVFATWDYAGGFVTPSTTTQTVIFEDFYYAENVPDDEKEELSHNNLLKIPY